MPPGNGYDHGMVTAWLRSGMLRPRSAGPLRLLWLAVLVLGVLVTHGASAESAQGHAMVGTTAPAHASAVMQEGHTSGAGGGGAVASASPDAAAADGQHEGDGSPHPAEGCVSGQPQQDLYLAAPSLSTRGRVPMTHPFAWGKPDPFRSKSAVPSLTGSRVSVVQQV
ncbi:hypothetical protein GCM10009575_058950 [Streptomyces rhizosphaericus]|uniref:Uncharacterized protein n=1 Tax=Streptomyces rhizosphaericus TaxID=114699 RepID=A0ABN1QH22_9ACTN